MELLVIILVSLGLCLVNSVEEEQKEEVIVRETKLNPSFYVDENAFMEVANALGFGVNSSNATAANVGVRNQSVHSVSPDTKNNVQSETDWHGSSDDNSDSFGVNWSRVLDSVESATH